MHRIPSNSADVVGHEVDSEIFFDGELDLPTTNKLLQAGYHSHPRRLVLVSLLAVAAGALEFGLSAEKLLSLQPFACHTAGMSSAVLFWCFGSAIGGLRRLHIFMQSLAFLACIIGYYGIYVSHTSVDRRLHQMENATEGHVHHHKLLLTHPAELFEKPIGRCLHVLMGYSLLFLVSVQMLSGTCKACSSIPTLKWHGYSGRLVCILGAATVSLGLAATVPQLVPRILLISLFCVVAILSHSMRWFTEEQQRLCSIE